MKRNRAIDHSMRGNNKTPVEVKEDVMIGCAAVRQLFTPGIRGYRPSLALRGLNDFASSTHTVSLKNAVHHNGHLYCSDMCISVITQMETAIETTLRKTTAYANSTMERHFMERTTLHHCLESTADCTRASYLEDMPQRTGAPR